MFPLHSQFEPVQTATDLRPGLEARLLDPLWLLVRQWTFGEFDGEDCGTPITAEARLALHSLTGVQAGGAARALGVGTPVEALTQTAPPRPGGPSLRERLLSGADLVRALLAAGAAEDMETLGGAFPVTADSADPAATAFRAAFGTAIDGPALLDAVVTNAPGLTDLRMTDPGREALTAWAKAQVKGPPPPLAAAWSTERLRYSFEVTAEGASTPLPVEVPTGGRVGWDSFSLVRPPDGAPSRELIVTATPTPLRYPGMPLTRYWASEDATLDLGSVDTPTVELGRAALLHFALLYGDDAFLLPVQIPRGTLARVASLILADTFAEVTGPRTSAPALRAGAWPGEGFALWTLAQGDAPTDWALFPDSAAAPLVSPPLAEALVARDEMSNLVWAVAVTSEGELQRAVRPPDLPRDPVTEAPGTTAPFTWRLATPPPPDWTPLALSVTAGARRLSRAPGGSATPGVDRLIPPGQAIDEAEVSREGLRLLVERVLARGSDGSLHAWTRTRRETGRGGAASGLRFDVALPTRR